MTEKSIARIILPVLSIDEKGTYLIEEDEKIIRKYEIVCISNGWTFSERDQYMNDYKEKLDVTKKVAISRIYSTENNALLNGVDGIISSSISSTEIIRNNLKDAIREFDPKYIIMSSMSKESDINIAIDTIQTPYIPDNVYYLVPEKIDPKNAKFVISEDIRFDDEFGKQPRGNRYFEMREWVSFVINNPNIFVKVLNNE